MCFIKYVLLFFCLVILECYALNCRTDGDLKDSELKNIYNKCLKMQNNKNSTSRNGDQDWKESRGYTQKDRDRDQTRENNNRNDWMGSTDSRTGSSESWRSNSRVNKNDRSRNEETSGRNDGTDTRYGGMSSRYDRTDGRHDRPGNDDKMSNRNDYYGNHDDRERKDHLSGRNDFQSDEFENNMYQYNGHHSSTQSPRRYKRDRRVDNTGQRSQYNPNTQRSSGHEDTYRSDEKNSSENNTNNVDYKACALNCFLETLEMTAEDGMPDKYLVTHAITMDVKNEDLRDFLQESIEECFQILENENIEDKCEFSKNLLLCLSEKGKANCDDWKDDLRF